MHFENENGDIVIRSPRTVFPSTIYYTSLQSISQSIIDNFFHFLLYSLIIHRRYDFYTVIQITRHPICRTEKNFFPFLLPQK